MTKDNDLVKLNLVRNKNKDGILNKIFGHFKDE